MAVLLSESSSKSRKLAALSPDAFNLFSLLIANLNKHGKLIGDPFFIKGLVVPDPIWPRFNVSNIAEYLHEISVKTNVKWFRSSDDGLLYIHSLNYKEHNKGLIRNVGTDKLPGYNGEPTPVIPSFAAPVPPATAEGKAPAGETPPPEENTPAEPSLITLDLKTSEWKGITADFLLHLQKKYPLVDTDQKLIELAHWIKNNHNEVNTKGKPTERAKKAQKYALDAKLFIQTCFGGDQKDLAAKGGRVSGAELEREAAREKEEYAGSSPDLLKKLQEEVEP